MRFSNINGALRGLLKRLETQGRDVGARGGTSTREIGPIQFTIEQPVDRCLVLPHRRNNVFASIAETMWVLGGRNDTEFLGHYLPRANDFSDDGTTWRGGYGPRLRDWNGIDQIDEVRRLLLADPLTRRAVAMIFDPDRDFVESRDIPCNNWLHFIQRDGSLNGHVAIRSNDLIWGFSGINAFEWSVLLEMLAHWAGASVGTLTFSVTSSHVYEQHFDRARAIAATSEVDLYAESRPSTFAFATSWDDFAGVLEEWFALEEASRLGTLDPARLDAFPDPLLGAFLRMLDVHWAFKRGEPAADVLARLEPLAGSDLGAAALEYLSRQKGDYPAYRYPGERANAPEAPAAPASTSHVDVAELCAAIAALHTEKTRSYGDSWKRRGELIGIMANVARKVDRLQLVEDLSADAEETALDTAVDLFVYCVKYSTFLVDTGERPLPAALQGVEPPYSDGCDGFDAMLAGLVPQLTTREARTVRAATDDVRVRYRDLEDVVQLTGAAADTQAKQERLDALVGAGFDLVLALVVASPASYHQFVERMRADAAPLVTSPAG